MNNDDAVEREFLKWLNLEFGNIPNSLIDPINNPTVWPNAKHWMQKAFIAGCKLPDEALRERMAQVHLVLLDIRELLQAYAEADIEVHPLLDRLLEATRTDDADDTAIEDKP